MKEINLISVFLFLTIAILTVEGHGDYHGRSRWNRKPGSFRPMLDEDDDDDDINDKEGEHSPPNTGQSLSCSYRDSTGIRVFCHSGCCLDDSGLVCCGTSDDTDTNKRVALYVILGLLASLLVGLMAAFVVFKLCKSKKTQTRRTTRRTTPLPDNVLPVKPQQTRQKPPRPQRKKEPMNSVFTVTPVLPSYADVTQIAESNRPPPEYSAVEPTFGSGYLRSFASPPPPYDPNGLETTDSISYSGNRSTRYSSIN